MGFLAKGKDIVFSMPALSRNLKKVIFIFQVQKEYWSLKVNLRTQRKNIKICTRSVFERRLEIKVVLSVKKGFLVLMDQMVGWQF